MPVSDFYYQSAYVEALLAEEQGPPTADNGLINGKMVNPNGTAGAYTKVTMQRGKTYRLRLINTSMDNHFKVSLDAHNLTVIAADFVPIVPYNTSWLFIGIGERYDVIITASQPISNYWFRAEVQQGCGSNANNGNIKAIFHYQGAATTNPNSTATSYTQSCLDETDLVPYVAKDVPEDQFVYPEAEELTIGGPSIVDGLFIWNVNGSGIDVNWEMPTLQYVYEGNTSYPSDLNLYQLPKANAVGHALISLKTC
jgi:FtsP/CotA-like multicopper oxidase with cupredoxin domain